MILAITGGFSGIFALAMLYGILYWVFGRWWKPITGKILKKEIKAGSSASEGYAYVPVISYSYFIDKEYQGDRLNIMDFDDIKVSGGRFSTRVHAQQVLDRFPGIGEPITIYYNPWHLESSVIERRFDWSFLIWFLICGIVPVICYFVYLQL